jgi:hypothetical protein
MLERLHQCDIGLFQYQLQYTFELLKELNTDFIKLMNERFKEIPRFRNVKIFKNGIYNLANFTASEYRQVMQQSVFVFDNLISVNQDIGNNITEVYLLWIRMYLFSQLTEFTEENLENFQVYFIL